MDIEYLQTLWQKDDKHVGYRLNQSAIQNLVGEEIRQSERYFRWRDWYELVGSVLIGGFFLYAAFFPLPGDQNSGWMVHWDRLFLAAGCFFITFVFIRLRLTARAFVVHEGDSLMQTLEKRRDALIHHIRAVKGILWWYILPVAIPLGVMAVTSFQPEHRIRFIVVCIVAFIMIVLLNRWYANRKLQPKLDSINQLIQDVK